MHKNEFIKQVARESGLPQAVVSQVLAATMRVIARALTRGEKIVWTGFGTFELRQRSARHGINPQTRQKIAIGSTRTPGFTASSTFKQQVTRATSESVSPAGDDEERLAEIGS